MTVRQTAGRDQLGDFAPAFARINDDVLFGEVWSRTETLGLRDRSIVTVVSLVSQGLVDASLEYHLRCAKTNGVTRTEIAEILTQTGFYAGWPKAWAAFRMAKNVWNEEGCDQAHADGMARHQASMIFPIGSPNTGFAKYFSGRSWLAPLASGTSRSSPPAATTGTSTRPNRAAARSSSAWRAAAGTMKTERTRSRSILATSSPFPQASSTGTAPQGTAGSRTSPSRCPASARATNGSSPSTRPSTTRLRDFPDEASARTRVRAG